MLVSDNRHVHDHLAVTGVTKTIGEDNLYRSDEWLGKGMRHAFNDAQAWVTQQTQWFNQTSPDRLSHRVGVSGRW